MDWYIIKNDGHKGPFTEEQIHILFHKGKIQKNDFLWNNEFEKPKMYESLFYKSEPKKLSLEATKTLKLNNKKIDKIPQQIKSNKSFGIKFKFKIYLITLVILICFMFPILKYNNIIRPSKMNLADFKRLEKVINDNSHKQIFDIAIAKDKSLIWLATNSPYEGIVEVEFKSSKLKNLADEKIEFKTKGLLKNKIVQFNSFEFYSGSKVVDGFYKIKFSTFEKLKKYWWQDFNNNFYSNFYFEDEFILSSLNKIELKKQLDLIIEKKQDNNFEFELELVQKYQTLKMISTQIKEGLNEIFNNSGKSFKEKVKNFEANYQLKYGQFFTSFVVANEKSYQDLEKKEFENKVEVISNYVRLSKLAKSIGNVTMESLEQLQTFNNKMTQKIKQKLLMDVTSGLDNIIKQCDEKIDQIEK